MCDIHGISRGKLVPSRSAESVLEKGMGSYIGKFMGKFFKIFVSTGRVSLIKKKIKFSSYIRKFRGIGCKVIYD